MAVTVQEQPSSRAGKSTYDRSGQQTFVYHVKGASSVSSVIAAVSAVAPVNVADPIHPVWLQRSEFQWSPLGFELWEVSVLFENPDVIDQKRQLETGSYRFSFSTTGGTARILTSLETIKGYTSAGPFNPANFDANDVPNFKQAIGVTRENDVQGVDIIVPALKFSIEYRQPLATITDAYVRQLETLTGKVNDDMFYNRPKGEVLFMGSSGSQGTDSDPTITYEFVRIPNINGQTIGDIANVSKKGHEYLWCLFEEKAQKKYVPKVPLAVYVERVYDYDDFSLLGIGG